MESNTAAVLAVLVILGVIYMVSDRKAEGRQDFAPLYGGYGGSGQGRCG